MVMHDSDQQDLTNTDDATSCFVYSAITTITIQYKIVISIGLIVVSVI